MLGYPASARRSPTSNNSLERHTKLFDCGVTHVRQMWSKHVCLYIWGMSGNGVKNYSKRARWSRNR